jgi:hypothetical protein
LLDIGLLQLLLRVLPASSLSSATFSSAASVLASLSALLLLLLLLEIGRLVTCRFDRAKLVGLLLAFISPLSSMILPGFP